MKIPKKIGKYEVEKQIGRGSMGVVCSARDPFGDALVAIKVALTNVLEGSASAENAKKIFFNEAYTAGLLDHPNILKVLDAGTEGELCYIVTELVEGGNTLRQYCEPDNLLPCEMVIEIVFRCAKALDYAHRQGVIHRDIKPTNILVTRDMDIRVADFGIARVADPNTDDTALEGFIGSPRYMSPEQIHEGVVSQQTDLFSLGLVMFELLVGKHPFHANTFSTLIHRIINASPPLLSSLRKGLPRILDQIVRHALEKTTDKRYKSGLNLAADLSLAFDFLATPNQHIEEQEKFSQVRGLSFFADFSSVEIWEILRICVWQDIARGEEIIIEGEIDDWFYIICSGNVEVFKSGEWIGDLGQGDCFGEMSYLSEEKRSATIVAKDAVSLMKINHTLMEKMSLEAQLHFSKMFLHTLLTRLSRTTAMYASARKH